MAVVGATDHPRSSDTDIPTQQFGSWVAELALGGVIERLNLTEVVDHDNAVDGGAQQRDQRVTRLSGHAGTLEWPR